MKKAIQFVLLCCSSLWVHAQITSPVKRANFGVDADLRANFFDGFIEVGNDDWFNDGTGGSGTFVIDTTGAAKILQQYAINPSSRMIPFFRGMRYPQFTVVNNSMLIDGIFIRDHHGDDSTVFAAGSNKNGMSPASWTCPVSQGIPDKNDILDMLMHVRRAGPNITDSLWMFGGISLASTTGNRYFDFEMYQTDIYFDRSTLSFKGYGPDAGHTSWQFDAAGNVTQTGDIIFTAEYSSSSLSFVEARIWIHNSAQSITPTAFSWGGSFEGATYGYASIVPKVAGTFYTGLQSSNNTWAGPFNVVLQDNSIETTYSARQFMEFSVNLSKLGLDPLVNMGDPCKMPFRKILVKSRSSTSFNAELKDFVGPFDFFRAPMASASADVPIFCGMTGVSNITVNNPLLTSLYTWTTPNGSIVGDSVGPSITVNQPGTYIVSQELMDSCGSSYAKDTVLITFDASCSILSSELLNFSAKLKDKAAWLSWTINNNPSSYYFEVERSYDGRHFTVLRRIYQTDETSPRATYSYPDDIGSVNTNMIYYRLKIVDKGGRSSYSRIAPVALRDGNFVILLTPNPVRNGAQLVLTGAQHEQANIYFIDMAGRVLKTIKANLAKGTAVVDIQGLDNWKSGTYLIKVIVGNKTLVEKMILTR
jgi:hypothetical protein